MAAAATGALVGLKLAHRATKVGGQRGTKPIASGAWPGR